MVSQSAIPTPALIPVTAAPPAAPVSAPVPATALTTSAPAEPQAPTTVPSEVHLPWSDDESTTKGAGTPKDGIIAAAAAVDPEPVKNEKEPSEPQAISSQEVVTDRRRSRPRSRSTSSCQSDKQFEVAKKLQGVALSDAGSKKVRGIGRGKPKNQGPVVAPSTSLGNITAPRENLRITIPAGSNKRIVEVIPNDFPANIQYLANLEGEALNHWELQLPAAGRTEIRCRDPARRSTRRF